jgi:NADH-quinone oxidoreductase subunit N
MMVDAISRRIERRVAGAISLIGLVGAAAAVLSLWGRNGETSFNRMIITDDFRLFFALIFLIVTFLIVLISLRWVKDENLPTGEYFALLMFATTGMLFMSAANDLVMIFLGLEITSISTYVLCGYRKSDLRSNESAVKYFILGSTASRSFTGRPTGRRRPLPRPPTCRTSRLEYPGGNCFQSRCCSRARL